MTTHAHLNDAQFTDLLSGTEAPAVLHHMQDCPACWAELERVRGAMRSFNDLSLGWAQRESVRIQAPAVPARRWQAVPTWSMAGGLAAVLAVAGLAAGVHVERLHRETVPAVATAAAASEATVAEDNQLMAAIDTELQQPVTAAVPVTELGAMPSNSKQVTEREATD